MRPQWYRPSDAAGIVLWPKASTPRACGGSIRLHATPLRKPHFKSAQTRMAPSAVYQQGIRKPGVVRGRFSAHGKSDLRNQVAEFRHFPVDAGLQLRRAARNHVEAGLADLLVDLRPAENRHRLAA